ncbi:MAG: hypothetical protein WAO08_22155 [Hyphomicrobiaceae bacterium]
MCRLRQGKNGQITRKQNCLAVATFWPALEQLLQGKPDVGQISDLMSDYWHLREAIGDDVGENPLRRRMLERMFAIQDMLEMDERGSIRQ